MASCFDKSDRQQIKEYYDREGVVCVRNMVSDIGTLVEETNSLTLHDDARVASRESICLRPSHSVSQHMYGDEDLRVVFEHLHGYPLRPASFPLEYREYRPQSGGMDWHRDLQMYEKPQVEMVLTVFNDDAQTRFEWIDTRGETQSISPSANDMVFVRPNGALHRVTPLGDARRGIIKMVAHEMDAQPLPAAQRERALCPYE